MTEPVGVSNQPWEVVDSEVQPGVASLPASPQHDELQVENDQLENGQQYEGPPLQQWNDSYDTCKY